MLFFILTFVHIPMCIADDVVVMPYRDAWNLVEVDTGHRYSFYAMSSLTSTYGTYRSRDGIKKLKRKYLGKSLKLPN